MEARSGRMEKLERILRELMEIHEQAPREEPQQFQLWLDMAISETRSQIEKMRLETVH